VDSSVAVDGEVNHRKAAYRQAAIVVRPTTARRILGRLRELLEPDDRLPDMDCVEK
jgi:hypothetical protein